MARPTLALVTLLFVLYIAYRLVSWLATRRRFQAFAERHGCKQERDLSGPTPLPTWRRLRRILKLKETGEDIFDDILVKDFEKASTISGLSLTGERMISTVEPANLQAMLATQFKDFEVGERRHACFRPLLGNSIFTSDGAFWEHSRALFRPQFARENINDLDMTDRACEDLVDAFGATDTQGWTADTNMMPLLYNFTLDTATDFLFGESIDSQAAATAERAGKEKPTSTGGTKHEDTKNFVSSLEVINDTTILRLRLGRFYWISDSLEFRRALRTLRRFTEHFVRLATMAIPSERKKDSLLNNLATQTHNRGELRDQTLSILLAGRDTTASLIGWCLVRLALHPEICAKLRTAILRDFPSEEKITFENLKACRYLQHFLNETLRLHPTVPFNARVALKDTTLPLGGGPDETSPVAIRKGQTIQFSVYIMQRRKDLWGEDVLEFRPERWAEERIPAWQFLPFLGGPRICLGQQFALTETSFLLCRLLQRFDAIEPVDKAEMARLKKGVGVTMWPADSRMRFHEAGR